MNEINELSPHLQFIRKRPGMFVGSINLNGVIQMLDDLLEDLLKPAAKGSLLEINLHPQNRICMKGTAIPSEKLKELFAKTESGTYDNNEMGLPVLMCLSSKLTVRYNDFTTQYELKAFKGNLINLSRTESQQKEHYFEIEFTPDGDIFQNVTLDFNIVSNFLRRVAYLNEPVKIACNDYLQPDYQRLVFAFPRGVFHLLDSLLLDERYPGSPSRFRCDMEVATEKYSYKIGIAYSEKWQQRFTAHTFAGNTETTQGGSLNQGILTGLKASIKHLAKEKNQQVRITHKKLSASLVLVGVVRGEDFVFSGSTKTKLGMPDVAREVSQLVFKHLLQYYEAEPKAANYLLSKFVTWEDME
ncbi:MAG: hypothetical protein IT236_17980 [Bacteroidia bacterium]|nr:hypothetical protein [Bacteroidia bacterium]